MLPQCKMSSVTMNAKMFCQIKNVLDIQWTEYKLMKATKFLCLMTIFMFLIMELMRCLSVIKVKYETKVCSFSLHEMVYSESNPGYCNTLSIYFIL